MQICSDVIAPMRDGCLLCADVYLPRYGARHPTILERTPYGRQHTDQSEIASGATRPRSRHDLAQAFTDRGYALVVQDCRGTGGSHGRFEKYVNEAQDGQDSLAWLSAQPWCDGKVGTMGFSYGSAAQLATASLGSPNLAAMFLDCGGFFDAHRSGIRQGGCFDLKQATWAYQQALRLSLAAGDTHTHDAIAARSLASWLRQTPWQVGHSPVSELPDLEREVVQAWNTEAFGPPWRRPGLNAKETLPTCASVPTFMLSAWFDTSLLNMVELWQALHDLAGIAGPLVLGPWTHGDRHRTWAGQLNFGDDAHPRYGLGADTLDLRLDWFDGVMRHPGHMNVGVPDRTVSVASDRRAPVRYFLMGGGSGRLGTDGRRDHGGVWMSATQWPPAPTRQIRLHLTPGSHLDESPGSAGVERIMSDPLQPVPTVGGAINSGQPVMEGGAFDQVAGALTFAADGRHGPLAERDDVLIFETQPLTQDLAVVGAVRALLFVATDGPDADVSIKLIDVYPPQGHGHVAPAYNISDGILRLSHRDAARAPSATHPGVINEIMVEAFPTANRFVAGHRIRLAIAGSNFPHFDLNPNVDPAQREMARARTAQLDLHMGPATPSCLLLDVMP